MRIAMCATAFLFLLWFGSSSVLAQDTQPPPEAAPEQAAAETPAVEAPQFPQAPEVAPTAVSAAEQPQPIPAMPAEPMAAAQNPQPQAAGMPPMEPAPAMPATVAAALPPEVKMPVSMDAQKPTEPDQFLVQASEAYKTGELKKSLGLIDKAQLAIRAKHVELYRPLLPPTPKDWIADDGSDSKITLDTSVVGGMSVISRKYSASGYTVKIGYIVDSPMMGFLSSLMKMVSSLNAQDSSMEVVQGNQALYKENDDVRHKDAAHQLMVMVGDVVVVIQSETLPKETLLQFANIVPYEQLKTVQ